MADVSSEITVTDSWVQHSTATTGTFFVQNKSTKDDIVYAFAAASPAASIEGSVIRPGGSMARGDANNHVWLKTRNPRDTAVKAHLIEATA